MLTFVFTLLFVLPIGILDAYVIRDMWLWFAVPALGVNPITVVQAFGLNLLVHSVIRQPTQTKPKSDKPDKDIFVEGLTNYVGFILAILLTWFIGYIVHSYF
jgi:hypothetical protein